MHRDRLTKRLLGFFVAVVLVEVIALHAYVSVRLSEYSTAKTVDRLVSNAQLIKGMYDAGALASPSDVLRDRLAVTARSIGTRLTVVDASGTVMLDTESDFRKMENHANRPEIAEALKGRTGLGKRESKTLGVKMQYIALPLVDTMATVRGAIRVSIPQATIAHERAILQQSVLLGAVFTVLLGVVCGYLVSAHITKPILRMKDAARAFAAGDLHEPVVVTNKDELGELAEALNHMAEELRVQIEELRKMDRMKTDFVANVSHELKTPLTSIKGFVETLEDGAIADPAHARRFLAIIGRNAERLSRIVDDLLSLCVLEGKKEGEKIEPELFDFAELADDAVAAIRKQASEKKQVLTISKSDGVFALMADKMRIEQVLVNLLANAVKYTPEGGVVIVELTAGLRDIRCSVVDTGIGIAKEHQVRVFERFYRVDKARSREMGGTGLGLSIVKHIVSAHHGEITLESEPGKGTRVTVTLPKNQAPRQ
jgi:two-component system phosphate regulon sensor histidine kinase PhoR